MALTPLHAYEHWNSFQGLGFFDAVMVRFFPVLGSVIVTDSGRRAPSSPSPPPPTAVGVSTELTAAASPAGTPLPPWLSRPWTATPNDARDPKRVAEPILAVFLVEVPN